VAPDEQAWLVDRLRQEREATEQHERYTLLRALTSGRVWLLCLLYLTLVIGMYGFGLWLPQIIEGFTDQSVLAVGLLAAIPYLVAAIGMVLVGRHSDQSGERRWHVAAAAFVGALGLVLSAALQQSPLALVGLSLAALGLWSTLAPFWALPTTFLTGAAAAGGIALINSVGNLGGFLGPNVVGLARDATGGFTGGLVALALAVAVGGLLALAVRAAPAPAGTAGK
jgi:ACS family tartrate transporter-like MFS transporter